MKTYYSIILFIAYLAVNQAYAEVTALKIRPDTSIVMEEDDQILRGVFSAAISDDEKNIVIVDKSLTSIYQYEIFSGKLINYYHSEDSLNKYVKNKSDYLKKKSVSTYKFIDNDSVGKYGLNRKMIINDFFDISYMPNGQILVGGFERWFSIDTLNKTKRPLLQNMTCFYFFDDSLNLVYGSPFETYRNEWPNATSLILYKDSGIIASVQNFDDTCKQLSAFTLFDTDGKRIKLLSVLPQDYSTRCYGYYLFYNVLSCRVNDKYFWTTQKDYRIRDIFSDKYFNILGFDTTNESSWIEYDGLLKKKKTAEEVGIEDKTKLVFNLRFTIETLSNWNDKFIAVHINENKNYIQFYKLNGNLETTYELIPNEYHKIEKVLFAPKSKKVITISMNDNNYFLCIYSIK